MRTPAGSRKFFVERLTPDSTGRFNVSRPAQASATKARDIGAFSPSIPAVMFAYIRGRPESVAYPHSGARVKRLAVVRKTYAWGSTNAIQHFSVNPPRVPYWRRRGSGTIPRRIRTPEPGHPARRWPCGSGSHKKLHACTDPHDPPSAINARPRDVVDLRTQMAVRRCRS